MKSNFTLYGLVLFLFFWHNSYSQTSNARVNYEIKINIKTDKDSLNKPSKIRQLILDDVSDIKLELLYNNNMSVFREEKALLADNKSKMIRKMSKTLMGVKEDFFSDLIKRTLIKRRDFLGEVYLIESSLNQFSWQILKDEKFIKGYKCYKALTTKTYEGKNGEKISLAITAWYTPSINIPLGPKDYSGLPGLILELHEGIEKVQGFSFYANKIELNLKQKIEVNIPKQGKIISQEKFDAIAKKAYVDFKN